MLSLLDAIAGFAQLGEWLAVGVKPWRFLLSSRYRERVRDGWRDAPAHVAAVQQIGGILVVVIELAIALILLDAVRSA